MSVPYFEIEHIDALPMPEDGVIAHCAFQRIDFTEAPGYAPDAKYEDCLFLGCKMTPDMKSRISDDCLVFPRMGMIYKAFTSGMYTAESLYEGYDPARPETEETCYDKVTYNDYIGNGKHADDIRETLARAIHDHSMSDALYDMLDGYEERDVVAVMGGHAMKRTDESYYKIAYISKALTERGKLMVSGGGPGAMEATHLGAWMAGRSEEELRDALDLMSVAPTFRDEGWLSTAFEVRERFPQEKYRSIGVPTWFYGHEPATPLATDIAKYFDNSIREDGILTIAKGGVIYSPGAAGTMQEIFQDAAQNHYETFGYASPMVFLGVDYYTKDMPVYPFLESLMDNGRYKNLILSITDDCNEIVERLS